MFKNAFTTLIGAVVLFGIFGCNSETNLSTKEETSGSVDITDVIFTEIATDCSNYSEEYSSTVTDIQQNTRFNGAVSITTNFADCTISVNGIPNHDFNDNTAHFATNVSEVQRTFSVPRNPQLNQQTTALSQGYFDAIMLNGVVVDMLSAGCYKPTDPQADADGNTAIGCNTSDDWLLDPLGTDHKFGADGNNAHTQPDGTYHYHGSPNAMFDDNPGENGSPVIGFAADGFPIYGSYFLDPVTNQVRKAVSGYELKSGSRPGPDNNNPGGTYNGEYIDDYGFTGAGDLDECNGMEINGSYGYYVTDSYPWILACHSGTLDESFSKGMFKGKVATDASVWHHEH